VMATAGGGGRLSTSVAGLIVAGSATVRAMVPRRPFFARKARTLGDGSAKSF